MKTVCSIAVVALLLAPGVATAQAKTVEELSKYLKKGDAIDVMIDGHRIRDTFVDASPSGLTLWDGYRATLYPAERIQRVSRRDGIGDGTLIGLGAGAAVGFIVALRMAPGAQRCVPALGVLGSQFEGCGDNRQSAFRTLTTFGIVAGAAIDGFKWETLYKSRPGAGKVSIGPVLGLRQQSLTARIAF